jgi:hypothetical protein
VELALSIFLKSRSSPWIFFLCCVIAVINIDNEHNAPRFRFLFFFLGIVEMCWLSVKGVMDSMDANGLFYGIQDRNNTSIVG